MKRSNCSVYPAESAYHGPFLNRNHRIRSGIGRNVPRGDDEFGLQCINGIVRIKIKFIVVCFR